MYVFSLLLFTSAEMRKHNPLITVFARLFVEVVSGSEGLCVCSRARFGFGPCTLGVHWGLGAAVGRCIRNKREQSKSVSKEWTNIKRTVSQ